MKKLAASTLLKAKDDVVREMEKYSNIYSKEKINSIVYKKVSPIYNEFAKNKVYKLTYRGRYEKEKAKNKIDEKFLLDKMNFMAKYINNNKDQSLDESELYKPLIIKRQEYIKKDKEVGKILNQMEENKHKDEAVQKFAKKYFIKEDEYKSKYPISESMVKEEEKDIYCYHVVQGGKKDSYNNRNMYKDDTKDPNVELYMEAYKNVAEEFKNNNIKKKEKKKKRMRTVAGTEYFHKGVYRQFGSEGNEYFAWSCCMKEDRFARGCERKYIKNFQYNYDII